MKVTRVISEHTAWDLGAQDWMPANVKERVRVKGGRALYESVWANSNRGDRVRLARLDTLPGMKIRELHRWISADAILEVVEVEA